MIANDFPPIGGAGVQRSLYFAKYLPEFGWRPVVLTVKDVAFPTKDPSLLDLLPPEVKVKRTESFELRRLLWLARGVRRTGQGTSPAIPAADATHSAGRPSEPGQVSSRVRELARAFRRWALVPDDRMLWAPFAIPRALKLLRTESVDAIYATVPCYSSGVIGQIVSRISGRPLVLDLRDPWTHDPYLPDATPLHSWLNAWLEATSVSRAARVVTISSQMTRHFRRAYPSLAEDRFLTLTNGYDAAEFADVGTITHESGCFQMVYSGSLYAHHRESLGGFCAAWHDLAERDSEFSQVARLVLVGRCDPEILQELESWPSVRATVLGYRPHAEALRHLKGSSALLLLIKQLDPDSDLITIPGKLFEYVGSGSPILMIGPEGDAADIVRNTGGRVHRQDDRQAVADSLSSLFHQPIPATGEPARIHAAYDRRVLTARLAEELDAVTSRKTP